MRRVLFFTLALLALGTQAHAMVLCATRGGAIVAADERCRKREVQLEARDLGVIGLAGLPGPFGPTGPDGPPVERPFRIVDANGVTACTPLASDGNYIQCVLGTGPDSSPAQLVLRPDGSDPAAPVVYYPTAGCQGPAYTRDVVSVISRATLLGPRLFVANGPHARLAALSLEQAQVVCSSDAVRTPHGTCCITLTTASEQTVAPTRVIELSTLGLTAPLRGEEP
jgi:hypothetical protein